MGSIGTIRKMNTHLIQGVAHYSLPIGDIQIDMNACIGKEIELNFSGKIYCIHCGTKTNKSFGQGYCYTCFTHAPETEECVLRPELCKAHLGIARDMNFAQNHCLIPHYVYLAETSDIKVGVTRNTQIPTRWIDQGALQAVIIAETPNRYTAGLIEVALKQYIADKTNWRKMLTKHTNEYNLFDERNKICTLIHGKLQKYIQYNQPILSIEYPGMLPNEKINSISLDKQTLIHKKLCAIKGQYLIFSDNSVINLRSHTGYEINFIS